MLLLSAGISQREECYGLCLFDWFKLTDRLAGGRR
jgi:hypothetical protein